MVTMKIDIPFEINEKCYIIINEPHYEKIWNPLNYSLGGDVDGPFDRGHYSTKITHSLKVKETKFKFGLLDKYSIDKIYKSKEDADWALLLREKRKGNKT
jgi:hypothetical protein